LGALAGIGVVDIALGYKIWRFIASFDHFYSCLGMRFAGFSPTYQNEIL
jgi:hypothetical protein